MLVFGMLSTVASSLAGYDVYKLIRSHMPFALGAIAGLLSTSVMSVAMVPLHEHRRPISKADAAVMSGRQAIAAWRSGA